MTNFWENKFKNEGEAWKREPADSTFKTLDLFKKYGFKKILIPGFGYGRNAKLFIDNGFDVTGIEISKSAIEIAKTNGLKCVIHHGSVINMPFSDVIYDGIYCYAMIYLLNKYERRKFLKACFKQLKPGSLMVFVVTSIESSMYGLGTKLSKNRYKLPNGLDVFFYDNESIKKEFSEFGLIKSFPIEEPIKFKKGHAPIKLYYVICKKQEK